MILPHIKKWGAGLILLLLLLCSFSPAAVQGLTTSNQTKKINIQGETPSTTTTADDYWAVIVVVFEYKNPDNNIDLPEEQQYLIYNTLLETHNWNENHVKFLLNEEATKNNILNALDWLASVSDTGDTIFFYFNGHGTQFPDDNGDEADEYDEVICPHNIGRNHNGELTNFIRDDTLDEKFDNVKAEGMTLIINSCHSGGLFNEETNATTNNFKKYLKREMVTYGEEITTDIEGNNRVILTSSMEAGLSIYYTQNSDPFLSSLVEAMKGEADENDDNVCSAEEICSYVKDNTLKKHLMPLLGAGVVVLIAFTAGGGPPGFAIGLVVAACLPFIMEAIFFLQSGVLALPFPQIFDGYEGDLPLIEYA